MFNTSNCACSKPLPYEDALVGRYGSKAAIATYTIIVAFLLVVTHLIVITKSRLWHTNWILEKIPQIVNSPISQILSQGLSFIAVIPYRNDLYLIWLVILLIAYDNVFTLSGYSLLEKGQHRMAREYLFFSNCVVIGGLMISYNKKNTQSVYYLPLLTLWSLILLKFMVRLFSYQAAEKAYGIKNTTLVADYMETKHMSNNALINPCDAQSMEDCKYLVIGEEKVDTSVESPLYTLEFKPDDNVVTVDRVWKWQRGQLEKTSIDNDPRINNVCLSFALFKLLRRRFFGFRAAESQEPNKEKTKQFVFNAIVSRHKEDCDKEVCDKEVCDKEVFSILRMEVEFLRDFFYTRYPVAFAFGFPVFSVVILIAMFAISLWISTMAFHEQENPSSNYTYLIVNHKNIDYRITNGLLIIIMSMEIFEVLSFVFSDWTKVIMVCRCVRSEIAGGIPFVNKMLGFFCKPKLSKSINKTIGQYSLLKNYNKGNWRRRGNNCLYRTSFKLLCSKMPPGKKEDTAIVVPEQVKDAILKAFKRRDGDFADRLAPLTQNRLFSFKWLANLQPLHTIMVWHIATSVCETRPLLNQPITDDVNCLVSRITKCLRWFLGRQVQVVLTKEATNRLVASSLSKYCAYLVVFAPELLPTSTSTFSAKRIFSQIVSETSDFFKPLKDENEAQYKLIMQDGNTSQDEQDTIINMGARLARQLVKEIPDDAKRWEVMAEIWSELILFLAPSGYTSGHLAKLASGGEFITHLWVLLYHAGIAETISEDCHIP